MYYEADQGRYAKINAQLIDILRHIDGEFHEAVLDYEDAQKEMRELKRHGEAKQMEKLQADMNRLKARIADLDRDAQTVRAGLAQINALFRSLDDMMNVPNLPSASVYDAASRPFNACADQLRDLIYRMSGSRGKYNDVPAGMNY